MSQDPDIKSILTRLGTQAQQFSASDHHLKFLIDQTERHQRFSFRGGGLFYDISRQRVDEPTMDLLFALAEKKALIEKFDGMNRGSIVNLTEQRAALHTASRSFSGNPVEVNGSNVMPDIAGEREAIETFSNAVRRGTIKGSTGKAFEHVVVVGIGGSYLGAAFVNAALEPLSDHRFRLHFLSNVDPREFAGLISNIDPETTLWIIVSKSYTTTETLANAQAVTTFISTRGLDPTQHCIAVTKKGSPGDDPTHSVLRTFHMFDFIGGRYAVSSAVGGVPLSIVYGYDVFERFLKGAEEMDHHSIHAPIEKNLPLISALISVWNYSFLGYRAQAIVPYASPLRKLAPHIQQLHMESNGKSVDTSGTALKEPVGYVIFGEPGTNAQHSFFQLAHQGRPFPTEFLGVIQPPDNAGETASSGVTNHQELWANMVSQATALAIGKDDENPTKHFPGNRPSSTLLLTDLSPENIGRLLSFYEARTIFEGFLWDINPFDQFGVELGKTTARGLREEIAAKNKEPDHDFSNLDPINRFYLETLFSGKL
ncbi:MAG: glucose-6-phosphate isomerase [Desulfobacterales bacterium]